MPDASCCKASYLSPRFVANGQHGTPLRSWHIGRLLHMPRSTSSRQHNKLMPQSPHTSLESTYAPEPSALISLGMPSVRPLAKPGRVCTATCTQGQEAGAADTCAQTEGCWSPRLHAAWPFLGPCAQRRRRHVGSSRAAGRNNNQMKEPAADSTVSSPAVLSPVDSAQQHQSAHSSKTTQYRPQTSTPEHKETQRVP